MNSVVHPPLPHAAIDWPSADGELLIAGRKLGELAAELGRDAFYAYDRARIHERIGQLRSLLPESIGIHYAIKANPLPELVAFMTPLVDGLDVASRREMRVALGAGMDASRISYAGPGKTVQDLQEAVAAGVLINVESTHEIDRLEQIAAEQDQAARIAIRVNPAFELRGAGMRMGGGAKPFGIDEEMLPTLLPTLDRPGLHFEGFHLYCGSQSLNAEAIAQALEQCYALGLRLAAMTSAPVLSLNLGGGFGIPYFPGDRALDLGPVAAALTKIAADAATRLPHARLHLELGRYLVGEAGIYATRIVDKKISRGETFLITAGGMNHHLAASGNLGQVIRKNYPVVIGNRLGASELEQVHIHGPLCTPLDVLAQGVTLPRAEPGDWVVVFQSGAYGYSASPHGFLSQVLPLEMLI